MIAALAALAPRIAESQSQDPSTSADEPAWPAASLESPEPASVPRASVDVDLAVDLPLGLSAGLIAGSMALLKDELVRDRCAPGCDRSALNGLDEPFAGRYDERAAIVGDVLVGVNLALPQLLGLLDVALGGHPEGALGFGEDALILGETLAICAFVQQIAAFATARPRPYTYGLEADEERRSGANAYLSFYSGHTANSFAMATAYSTLYGIRHPRSRWRGAVWALLHGLAAMDGALRVLSGYHFPTDVLVGGAVGSGIGLIVPWLHVAETPSAQPKSDAPLPRIGLVPMVSPTVAGLAVALY